MKLFKSKILLTIYSLILCFLIGELFVRLVSISDLDENIFIFNVQLKPHQLPIKETKKKLNIYETNQSKSRLLFDSKLGWSPNENFISENGLYIYNKYGERSQSLSDRIVNSESIKILLFGDSYMHGDEVKFAETIGANLEKLFSSDSLQVQVFNFAVSGYGMDQAFLRWEKIKSLIKPDFVIFGIQFENVKRNINVFRPIYSPITEIPFTKPRFTLKNGQLEFFQNPATTYNEIINKMTNANQQKYEGFSNTENYSSNPLYISKLMSFVNSSTSLIFKEYEYYQLESESSKITLGILDRFRKSVDDINARFIQVHLPVANDFYFSNFAFCKMVYGQEIIYEELLSTIKKRFEFIEIYPQFKNWIKEYSSNELFMERHYSPKTNKLLAKEIYNYLILNSKNLIEN